MHAHLKASSRPNLATVPSAYTLVANAVNKRTGAPDGVEKGAKQPPQYKCKQVSRSAAGSQKPAASCRESCAIYVAGSRGPKYTRT